MVIDKYFLQKQKERKGILVVNFAKELYLTFAIEDNLQG